MAKEVATMGLRQNLQNETVSQLSLREPPVATPDETLRDVIASMRSQKLGCAIIVDSDRKPIGIFTESVLTSLLSEQGATIVEEQVRRHMIEPCPCVKSTDPIARVLEAMQVQNLRFLCVVDEQGRVAGLTGQKGLIEFVADHFPSQVMVQRIGGKPYPSQREGA
jgi:CBS domain-containing protein